MDNLSREDLNRLLDAQGEWCLSVYMPTVRAGQETQQNAIRFKNVLRDAEDRLTKVGLRRPDAERFLQPALDLMDDADFWRHQGDGLALFLSPDGELATYCLPIAFNELVMVTRRFHIKPLLALLSGDGRFYVLALSQGSIRLLEGTRDSVGEVDLEDVPTSLAEALQIDEVQQSLQWQGMGRRAQGAQSHTEGGIYHGHGAPEQDDKARILRYFQQVDRGLRDLLTEDVPLVLAGVDYLLPLYAEANTYPNLLDEGITGSPEALSAKELHKRAWAVVEPYFKQAQNVQRERFLQEMGREGGQAGNKVKDVVRAAYQGRVAALFVPMGVRCWGVYDVGRDIVSVHIDKQPDDQDLFDLATVLTYTNGGTVYVVDQAEIPGGGDLAAVYRF